jgi:hypothetical protein
LTDKNDKKTGGQAKITLTLTSGPSVTSDLTAETADRVDQSISHLRSTAESGSLAIVSNKIDGAVAFTSSAQSAYDTAQTIGSCLQPLGQALDSLERIVDLVDGIVEVRNCSQTFCSYTYPLFAFRFIPFAKPLGCCYHQYTE